MRALSIRQPYAELILRGIKRIEYRSRPTWIIGERFWIYASKGSGFGVPGSVKKCVVGDNIAVPEEPLPPWMVELAEALRIWKPGELPTGVIVGSAVIEKVTPRDRGMFCWHLARVERAKTLRKPRGHPQPVWFKPF
jgi:hypothetical protein